MMQLSGISKSYRIGSDLLMALDHVDLSVESGESVAIRGRSGAGKSTLLHIMGGLDRFDSGEYFLDNSNVGNLNDAKLSKLRNQKIGFVLQDFSLINHKSVLFNVMLPLYFNQTKSKDMKEKALEALRSIGIEDLAHKKANQLSGGQRQRVAITRAIVNHPKVILADEPTGSLDTATADQVMKLLMDLNHQGITLIIVTHDDSVAAQCKRIVRIEDGKIQ